MEDLLKTREVMDILGLGKTTLIKLEKEGKLVPYRRTSRSKFYRREDVLKFAGSDIPNEANADRKTILYARVSSNSQKKELENQLAYLDSYAASKGIVPDLVVKDIGSGINYNNKGLNTMLKMVMTKEVSEIIITYKDRLLRFGFDMFRNICEMNGTKLTIINLQTTSPEEEILEDLLTVITTFSNRIYSLKDCKKIIKIEKDKENNNE